MINKSSGDIHPAFLFIVFLCAAIKLFLLFYVSNKGFDFNDEGYLMNIYHHGFDYRQTIQHNCYPLYLFPGKLNLSIAGLRILKFILEILLGCWLFLLLLKKNGSIIYSTIVIGISLVICSANLGGLTRMFGYNELVIFPTLLTLNIIIHFTNSKNQLQSTALLFLSAALSGVGLCIASIVKISSAPFLFIMYMYIFLNSTLLVFKRLQYQVFLAALSVFLGVAWGSYFLFFDNGFVEYLNWVTEFFPIARLIGYSPLFILCKSYIGIDILQQGVFHFFPSLSAGVFFLLFRNKLDRGFLYVTMLLLGIAVLILLSLVYTPAWLPEIRFRLLSFYIFLIQLTAFIFYVERKTFFYLKIYSAILSIPLIAVAGTNVPLSLSLSGYLMPWIVLSLVVAVSIKQKVYLYVFSSLILIVGFLQYISFGIKYVVRNPESLLNQHYIYSSFSETIFLDSSRAEFLDSFRAKIEMLGIKQSDKVIPLNNLPGETYLLGLKSSGLAWYFDPLNNETVEGAAAYNCYHIRRIKDDKPLCVFLTSIKVHEEQIKCMKDNGFDISVDYALADSIYNPIREVMVYIYLRNNHNEK